MNWVLWAAWCRQKGRRRLVRGEDPGLCKIERIDRRRSMDGNRRTGRERVKLTCWGLVKPYELDIDATLMN